MRRALLTATKPKVLVEDVYSDGTAEFIWTIPAGVTELEVEAYGRGGIGGQAANTTYGSGGGGGGSYIKATVNVSAENSVRIACDGDAYVKRGSSELVRAGMGGNGGDASSFGVGTGGNGGNESFNPTYCTKLAGAGGASGSNGSAGSPGRGGSGGNGGGPLGGSGGNGQFQTPGSAYGGGSPGVVSNQTRLAAGAGRLIIRYYI